MSVDADTHLPFEATPAYGYTRYPKLNAGGGKTLGALGIALAVPSRPVPFSFRVLGFLLRFFGGFSVVFLVFKAFKFVLFS